MAEDCYKYLLKKRLEELPISGAWRYIYTNKLLQTFVTSGSDKVGATSYNTLLCYKYCMQ